MTDFLDEKRREITDRLTELKPVVDEFHRLEAAAAALAGAIGTAASDAGHAVVRHRGRRRRHGSARQRAAATATALIANTAMRASPSIRKRFIVRSPC